MKQILAAILLYCMSVIFVPGFGVSLPDTLPPVSVVPATAETAATPETAVTPETAATSESAAAETAYGKAEFTETGCANYIEITCPDGWCVHDNGRQDGSVTFTNGRAVVTFSGYYLPQARQDALKLLTDTLQQSVNAQRKYYLTQDGQWYCYAPETSELTAGQELYYLHLAAGQGGTYATVAAVYLPEQDAAGTASAADFLAGCTLLKPEA